MAQDQRSLEKEKALHYDSLKAAEESRKKISEGSLSPDDRGYQATGTYVYSTDQAAESFSDVPYNQPIPTKNDLSPPSSYIEPQGSEYKRELAILKKECEKSGRTGRACVKLKHFLTQHNQGTSGSTTSTTIKVHEENNPYQQLGIFAATNTELFRPEARMEKIQANKRKKPIQTLYEGKQDNVQLTKSPVIRSECKCADGRVVLGYLDTRNGQKDCSPCTEKKFSNPNIYKNYATKKPTPIIDKPVNLDKQIGVSNFGSVNMKGCQTGADRVKVEKMDANKTLNKVISTIQERGLKVTTKDATPVNPKEGSFSIYDNCNMNIYEI